MRRRTFLENINSGNGVVDGSKATPLSVVFANKNDGSLTIVEGDKWSTSSYPVSTFEPIGIVVIPGEHGVLKDAEGRNQCGVMSLVLMNCTTPTSGSTNNEFMAWGVDGTDISTLTNYDKIVNCKSSDQLTATGSTSSAYIPRQDSVGGIPTWKNSSYCAPSPYANENMKSGEFNKAYSDRTKSIKNALSDFNGPSNTKNILSKRGSKNYQNWKPSYWTNSDYPAASCCDMFSTIGTKQGDWYLPAAGELGYIMPRFADISDTIKKLKTDYGVGLGFGSYDTFWSSTEFDSDYARYVGTSSGNIGGYLKIIDVEDPLTGCLVRAFLRL